MAKDFRKKIGNIKEEKPEDGKVRIYGIHPVEEYLINNPKNMEKIFIRDNIKKNQIDSILILARNNGVPFIFVPEEKILEKVGDINHQGIVAELSPVLFQDLDQFLNSLDLTKNPCVILLDELTDEYNVGAIIRTASALGISGIIMPKHRQAPISGAIYKASAGTAISLPIIRVTNINQTIDKMKEKGFWIYGLSEKGNQSIEKTKFDSPSCFIIGNEDHGIREHTLKHCDITIFIPMEKGTDSLNASVAASILIYEWKRRREMI